jgi:hypothetical protein
MDCQLLLLLLLMGCQVVLVAVVVVLLLECHVVLLGSGTGCLLGAVG